MSSLVGSHWISDQSSNDGEAWDIEEHTITVDLVSDYYDGENLFPRGLITFHRDDRPTVYISYGWNLFMNSYLRYD